ncbi:UNVERIFIED_CONTAM: hypothetical protein FKN15_039785 [Acipenser sinensis]
MLRRPVHSVSTLSTRTSAHSAPAFFSVSASVLWCSALALGAQHFSAWGSVLDALALRARRFGACTLGARRFGARHLNAQCTHLDAIEFRGRAVCLALGRAIFCSLGLACSQTQCGVCCCSYSNKYHPRIV